MTDGPGTILLVEDDVFISRMMELKFAKSGLPVILAHSGAEALARLDEEPIDLIITDLIMPEMSGLELIEAVRKRSDGGKVPILVLSGLDNTENVAAALKAGADDFMPKTKEHDLIINKVKRELAYLAAAPKEAAGGDRVADDALWNWSLIRGELQLSTRWKKMLGYEAAEIGKQPAEWLDRIHPDDRPVVDEALKRHLERKTGHFQADYRLKHKNGTWVTVHGFGVALFGKDGKAARMIGSMSLINDDGFRKRGAETLGRLQTALAENRIEDAQGYCRDLAVLFG
ncbi:MAG: response regulator [Acidobacteriota bacterium]|nr:response regulator [Acidobacteriota bacterium]